MSQEAKDKVIKPVRQSPVFACSRKDIEPWYKESKPRKPKRKKVTK